MPWVLFYNSIYFNLFESIGSGKHIYIRIIFCINRTLTDSRFFFFFFEKYDRNVKCVYFLSGNDQLRLWRNFIFFQDFKTFSKTSVFNVSKPLNKKKNQFNALVIYIHWSGVCFYLIRVLVFFFFELWSLCTSDKNIYTQKIFIAPIFYLPEYCELSNFRSFVMLLFEEEMFFVCWLICIPYKKRDHHQNNSTKS